MIRAALLAAVIATGCYSPGVDRCLYHCTAENGCPDNLTCNADNWCASAQDDSCEAAIDAPMTDVKPDSSCGWDTSNIDVCAPMFDQLIMPWTIDTTTSVDTDTGIVTPALPPGVLRQRMTQIGGGQVVVIATGMLTVNAALTVRGNTPLIILVSDNAVITSDIIVTPLAMGVAMNGSCEGRPGADIVDTTGGGGGGGGSFGSAGAKGGRGANPPNGGAPGVAAVQLDLTPLAGGCRGGPGGSGAPNGGGQAGGALQISAKTRIRITGGTVRANGGGGKSGSGQSGGGGGGSGGGILLESPEIKIMASRLCANGGGGGGSQTGQDGLMSDCNTAGPGGGQPAAMDAGGDGATAGSVAEPGRDGIGTASSHGGGGGGGGLGRIRLHTVALEITTSKISPVPGS